MKKKKHYCEECGKELTEYEYAEFESLCTKCYYSLTE
jgi:NMD protein affecting ribosome stability and mRNA decay